MMQLVVVAGRQSRRHRLGALAVARANQACHVERTHPPARLVPQPRQERRKPPLEIPIPVRHAAGSANHRAKRSSEILYKLSICQSSARCVVPDSDGASLSLIRQGEDALWQAFFTAAPARRRVFEPSSKRRKRAPAPLPPATA